MREETSVTTSQERPRPKSKAAPRKTTTRKATARKSTPSKPTARKPAVRKASAPKPSAAPAAIELRPEAAERHDRETGVPNEIKRWNWGAFFLNWIWSIVHSVWIGLLALVPFVGLFVAIYLGVKGNELAWPKRRWESPESFLKTQRRWGIAGAIAFGFSIVVMAISLAFLAAGEPSAPQGAPTKSDELAAYAAGNGGTRAGEDLGFSALFPGEPSLDSFEQPLDDITVDIHMVTDEVGSAAAFQVGVVDYPDSFDLSLPNVVLRGAGEGAAANIPNGKLTRFEARTIGGDPAADLLISGDGLFIRGRLILHGHRLYMIQVASETDSPPGYGRFVDSFKVL